MRKKSLRIENGTLVFKNHPIFIFSTLISVFTAISIIIIREIRNEIENNRLKSNIDSLKSGISSFHPDMKAYIIIFTVILVIFFIVLRSFLVWRNTNITLDDRNIYSNRYGLLLRNRKMSALKEITNVNLNAGFLYNLLGIKKVTIDINSSETASKDDYVIFLSEEDALEFREIVKKLQSGYTIQQILSSPENGEVTVENEKITTASSGNPQVSFAHGRKLENLDFKMEYSSFQVIRHMIISNSFEILFLVFLGALQLYGKKISFILLFFLLTTAGGLLKNLNKCYSFSVARENGHIHISYGLTRTENFVIPVENIISLGTKQNMTARIFNFKILVMDAIGYGNDDSEVNNISLYMRSSDIDNFAKKLLPEISVMNFSGEISKDIPHTKSSGTDMDFTETSSNEKDFHSLYSEDGVKPDSLVIYYFLKNIEYIFIPSVILYMIFGIIYILAAGFVISLLSTLYLFSNKKIRVENDKIIIIEGIFSKNLTSISFRKVENISLEQSIIHKKMKVARLTLYIRDAKTGKTSIETGLFKEDIFRRIILFYRNGEK